MKGTQFEEMSRVKIDLAPPSIAPAFSQIGGSGRRRSRRQRKMWRFIFCESIALALFIVCLFGGTSAEFAQQALTSVFVYGILFAAAALAIVPVVFFALPDQQDQFRRSR